MSDIRIQQKFVISKTTPPPAVQKKEDNPSEKPSELKTSQVSSTPIPAEEVLTLMEKISCSPGQKCTVKTKTIKISKYVTPEQASRIGDSVNQFFSGMESYVEKAVKEFNLPESQAQKLAALRFNQQFEDEDAAIVATGERFLV